MLSARGRRSDYASAPGFLHKGARDAAATRGVHERDPLPGPPRQRGCRRYPAATLSDPQPQRSRHGSGPSPGRGAAPPPGGSPRAWRAGCAGDGAGRGRSSPDARTHLPKISRQARARGSPGPVRNRLPAADGNRHLDKRNGALLAVACDTLLRRTGRVSPQVAAILRAERGPSLPMRGSKADRECAVEMAWRAPESVKPVAARLALSGIGDGALLRSIARGERVGGALPSGPLPRLSQATAREACLWRRSGCPGRCTSRRGSHPGPLGPPGRACCPARAGALTRCFRRSRRTGEGAPPRGCNLLARGRTRAAPGTCSTCRAGPASARSGR